MAQWQPSLPFGISTRYSFHLSLRCRILLLLLPAQDNLLVALPGPDSPPLTVREFEKAQKEQVRVSQTPLGMLISTNPSLYLPLDGARPFHPHGTVDAGGHCSPQGSCQRQL